MKRLTLKFIASAAVASLGVAAFAGPASADPDGNAETLVAVGSDTTYYVMNGLAQAYNSNSTHNAEGDQIINVPPLHYTSPDVEAGESTSSTLSWLATARNAWPGGEIAPPDANCTTQRVYGGVGAVDENEDGDDDDAGAGEQEFDTVTVDSDESGGTVSVQLGAVAANGSGSGRSMILDSDYNNDVNGCIDLGRSSSAPGAAEQDNFDTWAFALDGIGWVYFKGNDHNVVALSKDQLGKMYNCSATNVDNSLPADGDFTDPEDYQAGQPYHATWGEVSGIPTDTDPIKTYRIQNGSGTGNDVASTLLGLTAATIGQNCTNASTEYPVVQEHDCRQVTAVDLPDAVCFYGYSRYKIQSKSLEVDKRQGSKFGAFYTGVNAPIIPSPSTIKEDSVGRYEGTRLIYNVVFRNNDASANEAPGFDDLLEFTGVNPDPDGAGPLLPDYGFICNNEASKIIKAWGLITLKKGTTDTGNTAYGTSYCRHNKYTL